MRRQMAAASSFPAVPIDVDRDTVLAKCAYFTTVGLWPLTVKVDPRAWLSNFDPEEERYAVYLLNAFLFFNEHIIDRVFVAACQSLSRDIPQGDPRQMEVDWSRFLDGLIVTAVRGERPAATDSGALFTRRARALLGIPKGRILDQPEALEHLVSHGGDVLFVDDFVGTGSQFLDTFARPFRVAGERVSFSSLAERGIGRYFYCPVVATSFGMERISGRHPKVILRPGHALPPRYSAFHPDSLIWPDDLRPGAEGFIRRASARAGIPDAPGKTSHWKGFGDLGLVVAFAHGAPDATLPLIWWEENNWKPLRGRR